MDRHLHELAERGLREAGLAPSEAQLEALVRLAELLGAWAPRINLSGHRDAEGVIRRLVLDAGAILAALPPFGSLADLGSGAGFPGLPFAVLNPDARIVLVESRLRRHHFQRAVIRELALCRVRAVRGRIELVPADPCEVVVAQAVAAPSRILPLMRRWAAPGGLLVLPGGAEPPRPLDDADARSAGLGDVRVLRYRIPLDDRPRTLWTARVA